MRKCRMVMLLVSVLAGTLCPAATVEIPDGAGFVFTAGATGGVGSIVFSWNDSRKVEMPLRIVSQWNAFFTNDFPDAALSLGKFATQYVRPRFKAYQSEWGWKTCPAGMELARNWDALPKASEHSFALDVLKNDAGFSVWIDGSYAGDVRHPMKNPAAKPLKVEAQLAAGVRFSVVPARRAEDPRFEVLRLDENPRAKAMAAATLCGIAAGPTAFDGVPLCVAPPAASQDAGICKAAQRIWKLCFDEYRARSPQDGFPHAVHYRVKSAPFLRAHVLVAFDPAKGKTRRFSVLQSVYEPVEGAGDNRICQADVDFTAGVPAGFRQVGEVALGDVRVPLYYGAVNFDLGPCIDLAEESPHLDIELNGTDVTGAQPSGANFFAVTLEKSPVLMMIEQTAPGNVFTRDEVRKTTGLRLRGLVDFSGSVTWSCADAGATIPVSVAAGETRHLTMDLSSLAKLGIYDLTFVLKDAAGRVLVRHEAKATVLPEADRNADRDILASPYYCWWFTVHGTPSDPDVDGPLIRKAGIHKVGYKPINRVMAEKYALTSCGMSKALAWKEQNFDRKTGRFRDRKGKTGEELFVEDMKRQMVGAPHVDRVLVWHEDSPDNVIPEEILGLPVPAATEADREAARYVNECGRLLRKHFPKLRIELGNWLSSLGAAVLPLRGGADPQYYDAVSIESGGWSYAPERPLENPQAAVLLKDALKAKVSHPVYVNGCWEYTSRTLSKLGAKNTAAYHVRDIVIGLAHGFDLFLLMGVTDPINGYYASQWGRGTFRRYPFLYPSPSYLANAVLTKCLDLVTFSRQLDTGSSTVYALEFKRADGRYATALWTARGEADVRLDGTGMLVSMYGEERPFSVASAPARIGSDMTYAISDVPLAAARVVRRAFAADDRVFAAARVVAPLVSSSEVVVTNDAGYHCADNHHLPIYKLSEDFVLSDAVDPEAGRCLELKLDASKREMNRYFTEYTVLRLARPVPIPAEARWIGLRVKGDSNWGQLRFEIEDATGDRFRFWSRGTDKWARDWYDCPGTTCVNFDGWSCVYYLLGKDPMSWNVNWANASNPKARNAPRPPFMLTSVMVSMNRTKLGLLDFSPSGRVLRLKDLFWSSAPEVRRDD